MTYRQFLAEHLNKIYDFSLTQINLPKNLSKEIIEWGIKYIPDKNIYTTDEPGYGREDEIHTTLLYGLHDKSDTKVRKLLAGTEKFECRMGEIKSFENNDYDVIFISIHSEKLHELNRKLKKLKFTSKYTEYKPHVTIAYTKKDKSLDLVGHRDFSGRKFTVDEIIFLSNNGNKTRIKLEG